MGGAGEEHRYTEYGARSKCPSSRAKGHFARAAEWLKELLAWRYRFLGWVQVCIRIADSLPTPIRRPRTKLDRMTVPR